MKLNEKDLRRLCEINSFPIPLDRMIFFGLRGCLPEDDEDHEFKTEHGISIETVNYMNPRCTLGQWLPQEGKIALFPGSTVPHKKHIRTSLTKSGRGCNALMTGYYADYKKGPHPISNRNTRHDAFRQQEGRPIRRTADDFDYDNDDRVEFANPYDNLHAAWCHGINHDSYSSAGCQVVVGFPKCIQNSTETGPWKVFRINAYNLSQNVFPYILLNGRDAKKVITLGDKKTKARLRYGSKGELVTKVQEALKRDGFYEGSIDDDFGKRTVRAVLDFQTDRFGPDADDGIVGVNTAEALGLTWPNV